MMDRSWLTTEEADETPRWAHVALGVAWGLALVAAFAFGAALVWRSL